MIGVLVVEDDFRVAALHADLVAAVPGMRVVGVAHDAAQAVRLASETGPDLVLLDEHLPDAQGSSLLGRLDAAVILVTAESDADRVRSAIARGALNVVLKPFPPALLRDRLLAFARFWEELGDPGVVEQQAVDRALGALRSGDAAAGAMPKGRSAVTADAVRDALREADDALSAQAVADATGISRATAQRYLADLVAAGRCDLALRYGSAGRPEHRYSWRG